MNFLEMILQRLSGPGNGAMAAAMPPQMPPGTAGIMTPGVIPEVNAGAARRAGVRTGELARSSQADRGRQGRLGVGNPMLPYLGVQGLPPLPKQPQPAPAVSPGQLGTAPTLLPQQVPPTPTPDPLDGVYHRYNPSGRVIQEEPPQAQNEPLMTGQEYWRQYEQGDQAQPASFVESLIDSESGGNWGAANDWGYVGRLQFGDARLADFQRDTGTSFTKEQFRTNPDLQRRVEKWHFDDINRRIDAGGLDDFIGKQVKGIPITRSGMLAVAHLGGFHGMRKFLESGGEYDPADFKGTRLSTYLAKHSGKAVPGYEDAPGQPGPQVPSGAGSGGMSPMNAAMADQGGQDPRTAMLRALMSDPDPRNYWERLAAGGGLLSAMFGQGRRTPEELAAYRAQQLDNLNTALGMLGQGQPAQSEWKRLSNGALYNPATGEVRRVDEGQTKEQQEATGNLDKRFSNISQVGRLVREGFEKGALGPWGASGINRATDFGASLLEDLTGIKMGAGVEQRDLRTTVEAARSRLITDTMATMKGALSDKDVALIQTTVPELTDGIGAWNRYFDELETEVSSLYISQLGMDPAQAKQEAKFRADQIRREFFGETSGEALDPYYEQPAQGGAGGSGGIDQYYD